MELSAGFIHLITNKVLKLYGGDLAIGAMTAITSINLLFLILFLYALILVLSLIYL